MKKLLNKPWFVAVLSLVAVAVVAQALLPERKPARRPRATAGGNAAASSVALAGSPGSGESDTEATPESGLVAGSGDRVREAMKALAAMSLNPGRDPFAPRAKIAPVAAVEKPAEPDIVETVKLSAIWTQSGQTYVLLNGRICLAGDSVGRLTIESADQNGIWLRHWKGRDFVPMGAAFTLTTPARQASTVALTRDS